MQLIKRYPGHSAHTVTFYPAETEHGSIVVEHYRTFEDGRPDDTGDYIVTPGKAKAEETALRLEGYVNV